MPRKLVLLLLLTVAASFAYTPLQVGPTNCVTGSGTTITTAPSGCAFGANVSPNSVIVVAVEVRLGLTTGVSTVTDTRGTTFTFRVMSPSPSTNGSFTSIWTGKTSASAPSADTISVTLSGATPSYVWAHILLAEYDGTQVANTIQGTASNAAPSGVTAMNCGSFTPTANNVQVVAGVYSNASVTTGGSFTANSPLTFQLQGAFSSTTRKPAFEDYFMAVAAPINPGASDTTNSGSGWAYSCAAVALDSVSGGPTLTGVAPTSGTVGNTVGITLTGTNLTGATSISAGSGITVSNIVVVSAVSVTADFAISGGATPGTNNVTITTPNGTSNAVTFTISAARRRQPTITGGFFGDGTVAPTPLTDWSIVWWTDQHPDSGGVPFASNPRGGAGNASFALNNAAAWNTQAYIYSGDTQAFGETNFGFNGHGWDSIIATGKPTIVSIGNHDCDDENSLGCSTRKTAQFDQYTGYQRVTSATWGPVTAFSGIGNDIGLWPDTTGVSPPSQANYAIRFAYNGHKFLVISLEFIPRLAVMTWADNLTLSYPDHKVIWVTHTYQRISRPCTVPPDGYCAGAGGGYSDAAYVDGGVPRTGQFLYDNLFKLRANTFLTLSGHFPQEAPAYGRYISTGDNSNPIYGLNADFQPVSRVDANTNDEVMRLVFHESTQTFDWIIYHSVDGSVLVQYLGMTWPQ